MFNTQDKRITVLHTKQRRCSCRERGPEEQEQSSSDASPLKGALSQHSWALSSARASTEPARSRQQELPGLPPCPRAGPRGAAPASALRQAAAALELVCALPSDSGKPGRAAAARARAARIIYHYMKGLFGGCRDLLCSHRKGAERRHQDPPGAGVCRGTHGVWEGRPAAARPGDPRTLEGGGERAARATELVGSFCLIFSSFVKRNRLGEGNVCTAQFPMAHFGLSPEMNRLQ